MTAEFRKINDRLYDGNRGELSKGPSDVSLELVNLELLETFEGFGNFCGRGIGMDVLPLTLTKPNKSRKRSINGLAKLDRQHLYIIDNGFAKKLSKPLPIHISERKMPSKLTLNVPDLTENCTGILGHYIDEDEPITYLDIGLPKHIFERLWDSVIASGSYSIRLTVNVDIFQSNTERLLGERWYEETFYIESDSQNQAWLGNMYIDKVIAIIPKRDGEVNDIDLEESEQNSEVDEMSSNQFVDLVFLPSMKALSKDLNFLVYSICAIIVIMLIKAF